MDATEGDCGALGETTVFLSFFKDLPDHRQPGKVIYPLDEILLLCLLAVPAGVATDRPRPDPTIVSLGPA
jgi:hypothetical protein